MGEHSPCHWINDATVGRVHIPGCMGAAVYGPRGCTCPTLRADGGDRWDVFEKRIAELEKRLSEMPAERPTP